MKNATLIDPVRRPAVAGAFYPGDRADLSAQVQGLLAAVPRPDTPRPKAIIAPHAGYIYSGPTAASAYAALSPHRDSYTRVVLLGPAHRMRVRGLALPASLAFATPLGEVPLDRQSASALRGFAQVCVSEPAHALEHSIEVHLPFLQSIFGAFSLVPMAVGAASTEEVAEVLEFLWGGDETLIVVSSDLSHYLSYAEARKLDGDTVHAILDLRAELTHEQACGATPVNGLLKIAARRGLRPRLLDLRNSGDTAGDRNRVVGYASFAFHAAAGAQDAESNAEPDGMALIALARSAIAGRFGHAVAVRDDMPWLLHPAATFVTLKQQGRLRGCIGSLSARRPLKDDVRANARSAAFEDPRFPAMHADELDSTRIEVSLLSGMQPMTFRDEADLLSQLRPGIDGLALEHGHGRGTFLPQVWETIADPRRFLAELKRKAGLAHDFWDGDMRISRYTVKKWAEPESR
ncbi:MAG TPA: AmmeMemoRadiSam system protein B [Burkholderiales bacterium]|nr:AmmeMemoRadiSam system protein B [Burkholderiales bacterium]